MRIPRAQTFIFGLAALAVLLAVGYVVSRPRGPVLVEADVSLDRITPNADGQEDVTRISYRLRRLCSIY